MPSGMHNWWSISTCPCAAPTGLCRADAGGVLRKCCICRCCGGALDALLFTCRDKWGMVETGDMEEMPCLHGALQSMMPTL